jgi:hypothetical protein
MDNLNTSVLTPLAFSFHLKGEYHKALDLYHKINFIKSDDPTVAELINRCLADMLEAGIDEYEFAI